MHTRFAFRKGSRATMPSMSSLNLYDLAGAQASRRTSPYCWRIKFALAHKRLLYQSIPWRRVEKDAIAFSGQGKVPVLVDGQDVVCDSWQIAEYLDKRSGNGSLLEVKTAVKFTVNWVNEALLKAIRTIVAHGAIEVSADEDKEYYREKLEAVHGVNLQMAGESPQNMAALQKVLEPMRVTIQDQPFLGGEEPNFADFAVAGAFAWARSVSPIILLKKSDPVYTWRQRIFALFPEELDKTLGYSLD